MAPAKTSAVEKPKQFLIFHIKYKIKTTYYKHILDE